MAGFRLSAAAITALDMGGLRRDLEDGAPRADANGVPETRQCFVKHLTMRDS